MSPFEIDPALIAARPQAGPNADPDAVLHPAVAPQTAEQRVAQQEEAIFRATSLDRLTDDWRRQEQAQWQSFDPDADEIGDAYAGVMAEAIDRSLDEAERQAPSVAAGEDLLREVEPLAEAGKRAALLRERGARLGRARAALARRVDALQGEAEREPGQLGALLTQSDRLLGQHRTLLGGRDMAALRRSAHETLARRAIAGALSIDAQDAAGRLPGRAVLDNEELAAWDGVAHAMAELQAQSNGREWGRRFALDLKSVRETGEPGFELVDWIAEASGGADGRIGRRLKQAEAVADRLVLARQAAREAHRRFQAIRFDDFAAELAAPDDAPEDDGAADSDTDHAADLDDATFWSRAQDGEAHLALLRRAHVRRLRADPAAAAFEHALVRRAWDKGDAEGAIARGLQLQQRMGVAKPLPLPRAQADSLVQHIAGAPLAEAPALLENLKRAGEAQLAPLLAQLVGAGLPPALALAGVLSGAARAALLTSRDGVPDATAAKADSDIEEQARAGFAETRLGLRLHRGAEKSGRAEPAWEQAYRAAEAAVVQVGMALARSEGAAGAARAGRLLFGALETDDQALARTATVLGAPRLRR